MGVGHSLYDALVSINVPNEKALAVADAMEQDMLEKLMSRTEFKSEMQLVRQEFAAKLDLLARDIQATNARIDSQTHQLTFRFIATAATLASLVAVVVKFF